MAQYAKNQAAGFVNRISKVAIIGVSTLRRIHLGKD